MLYQFDKNMMDQHKSPEIQLLHDAYTAFNARDIDGALALMTLDVEWPRAFKGGFVHGPEAIRAYWTEQWNEIDGRVTPLSFQQESVSKILVEVHQVVRDLTGTIIADDNVYHRFTFVDGLIDKMELAESGSNGNG